MVVKENRKTAIVAGAGGQDGYFLTERLLRDGWVVHATVRPDSIPASKTYRLLCCPGCARIRSIFRLAADVRSDFRRPSRRVLQPCRAEQRFEIFFRSSLYLANER